MTLGYVGDVRFNAIVLERGLPHAASADWTTSAESLDALLPYAIASGRWRAGGCALLDLGRPFGDPCLALVELQRGRVDLSVAAGELAALADVEDWVLDALPRAEPGDRKLTVEFWSSDYHSSRTVEVPSWGDVRSNYPASVRGPLETLMATRFEAETEGRLLLWHGAPGTGKTFAVRALGWEWREWCDLHYVTDPEVFFGQGGRYMMRVLLDEEDDGDEAPRWRLLVLEDTGELLTADAKERAGQGLSRLLNLVDGLIGQGLRLLVLVTTNEPLRRLHPAVARPGRAAATVEFGPFEPEESAEWLVAHGARRECRLATLAELFALAAGREVAPGRKVGF
jgi:hypothetical protein